MIRRALDGGAAACAANWRTRGTGYVLAVARSQHVATAAAHSAPTPSPPACPAVPGSGYPQARAPGPCYHDWAWITTDPAAPAGHRSLLIRRNPSTGEFAGNS